MSSVPPIDSKEWCEDYNPWHPIQEATELKVLAKLGEEANELGSAVCRCIMQGVDECHPVTGKLNRTWLEDEAADVMLCLEEVLAKYDLDVDRMRARMDRKRPAFRRWHTGA